MDAPKELREHPQGSPWKALHPSSWKAAKGYANGILSEGRTVWVGGQIGWNAEQTFESDDFVVQVRQALHNIVAVLREAEAGPEHLVRLTWFVVDKGVYLERLREVGAVYREVIGRHYPAMSLLVVKDLLEDRAQVEIEATAVVPSQRVLE